MLGDYSEAVVNKHQQQLQTDTLTGIRSDNGQHHSSGIVTQRSPAVSHPQEPYRYATPPSYNAAGALDYAHLMGYEHHRMFPQNDDSKFASNAPPQLHSTPLQTLVSQLVAKGELSTGNTDGYEQLLYPPGSTYSWSGQHSEVHSASQQTFPNVDGFYHNQTAAHGYSHMPSLADHLTSCELGSFQLPNYSGSCYHEMNRIRAPRPGFETVQAPYTAEYHNTMGYNGLGNNDGVVTKGVMDTSSTSSAASSTSSNAVLENGTGLPAVTSSAPVVTSAGGGFYIKPEVTEQKNAFFTAEAYKSNSRVVGMKGPRQQMYTPRKRSATNLEIKKSVTARKKPRVIKATEMATGTLLPLNADKDTPPAAPLPEENKSLTSMDGGSILSSDDESDDCSTSSNDDGKAGSFISHRGY